MVLRMLGVSSMPTQRELYEMAGSGPLSADLLAAVMNEIWGSKDQLKWQARCFDTKSKDLEQIYDLLRAMSPWWIAHLRIVKQPGHLVVVGGTSSNRIEILDPEQPGSYYWMTPYEFKQFWNGSTVYLTEEAP